MPANFQLTQNGSTEPMKLSEVDDLICKRFGFTPTENWHNGWYYCIGLRLAMQRSWNEIQTELDKIILGIDISKGHEAELEICHYVHMRQIAQYLEDNFTVNAWRS